MEITPRRARIMLIRWTIYPFVMAALAIFVFTGGNNPALGWVFVVLFALSIAFRFYLARIVRQQPDLEV